jgi:hypothetical protein
VQGGDSIWAKVSAVNFYGETDLSTEGNNANYYRVPDAPINLAENTAARTSTTNGITWSDGTNNGGLAILDYRINMRVEGGVYAVYASGVTT